MKKAIIIAAFLAFSAIGTAQVDKDNDAQPDDDQLQQLPQREVRTQTERAATREATRDFQDSKQKSQSEFQAEKRAKDKGRTQKQTTGERPVSDTVKKVKPPKPQIQGSGKRK